MSQVERKWILDHAINNSKVDPTDTYTITGLRVDETNVVGRVGIGLSSPLDALHIQRSDSSAGLMLDSVDGTDGERYQIYSGTNGLLNFRDSTTDNLVTIGSTNEVGCVGINTTTIEDHIHISSPSTDAALRLDLNDGTDGRAYRLVSDTDGAFRIIDVDATAIRVQIVDDGTLTYNGDATFVGTVEMAGFVMPTGATNGYVLKTDSNGVGTWQTSSDGDWTVDGTDMYSAVPGNIGIGSTNPTYKLDVVGTVKMDSFVMPTGASNGYVLKTDGDGVGTWQAGNDGDWIIDGTDMYSGASGNVGIGGSSPSFPLDVRHSSFPFIANFARQDSGEAIIQISDSDSTAYIGVNNTNTFIGGTNTLDASNLVILNNGNVGIGITNPTVKLMVDHTDEVVASFSSNAGNAAIRITDSANFTDRYIGASNDIMYLGSSPFSSTADLYIDSSGNVGIKTSGPEGLLHIRGGSAGSVTPDSSADDLIVEANHSGGISILTPDNRYSSVVFGSPLDNMGAYVRWMYDASIMSISTGMDDGGIYINTADEVNAMIIDSGQNVGIGVTSVNYRLDVTTSDEIIASFESSGDEGVIQIVNGDSVAYIATDLGVTSIGGFPNVNASNLNIVNTTGNVGIGTDVAGNKLEVVGTAEMTGFVMPTDATNGFVLTCNGSGVGTWQAASGADSDWMIIGSDMCSTPTGMIGIGTATPGYKLDVQHATDNTIANFESGTDTAMIKISDNDTNGFVGVKDQSYFFGGISGLHGNNIVVLDDGNVGLGTTSPTIKLDVVGNARISAIGSSGSGGTTALYYDSTGELTSNTSDKRLKYDIKNLENVLEKVGKLRGVSFKWKQSDIPMVGMIAQELQEEYPELVFTNRTDGYMGIRYGEFTAVLLESVKELNLKSSKIGSKIESLESKISEMMNM